MFINKLYIYGKFIHCQFALFLFSLIYIDATFGRLLNVDLRLGGTNKLIFSPTKFCHKNIITLRGSKPNCYMDEYGLTRLHHGRSINLKLRITSSKRLLWQNVFACRANIKRISLFFVIFFGADPRLT